MTYDELISEVAYNTGLTLKKTREVVQITFDIIAGEIRDTKGYVKIPRFGMFESKFVAAHMVTNPRTKEKMKVPNKHRPHFRASTILRGKQ